MKKGIGLTALVVFVISASTELTHASIGMLVVWGLVIITSLAVAGMALRQQEDK